MKALRIFLLITALPLSAFAQRENIQRVPGTNTITGANASAPFKVETIAALRAVAASARFNGLQVEIANYATANDGGGGIFYFSAASAVAENGGTVIAPATGTGRWLRLYDGAVSVRWFGAKGDRLTNDTAAIRAAIGALKARGADGKQLRFTNGTYLVSDTLDFSDADAGKSSSWTVDFDEGAMLVLGTNIASGAVMNFTAPAAAMSRYNKLRGAMIYTEVDGARAKYGISLENNTQFIVENVRIVRGWSDAGLWLKQSYNGTVINTEVAANTGTDYTAVSSLGYGVACYVGNQSNALALMGCNFNGALATGTVGVEIQGAIFGVTFQGCSYQQCRLAGLRITNTQAANINVNAGYFEGNVNGGGTAADVVLSGAGYFSGITFQNCFINSDNYGFYIDAGTWSLDVSGCLFDNAHGAFYRTGTAAIVDSRFSGNVFKDLGYADNPIGFLTIGNGVSVTTDVLYNVSARGITSKIATDYSTVEYPGANPANIISDNFSLWVPTATVTIDPNGLLFGSPVAQLAGADVADSIEFAIPVAGLKGKVLTVAFYMRRTSGSFASYLKIIQNGVRNVDFNSGFASQTDWNLWQAYYAVHPTSDEPVRVRVYVGTNTVQVATPVGLVGIHGTETMRSAPLPGRMFFTGTASPIGSKVPAYVGQEFFDSATPRWYRSTGLTNADWVALH